MGFLACLFLISPGKYKITDVICNVLRVQDGGLGEIEAKIFILAKYNKARKNVLNLHSTAFEKKKKLMQSLSLIFFFVLLQIFYMFGWERGRLQSTLKKRIQYECLFATKNVPPEDFFEEKNIIQLHQDGLDALSFWDCLLHLGKKRNFKKKKKKKKVIKVILILFYFLIFSFINVRVF